MNRLTSPGELGDHPAQSPGAYGAGSGTYHTGGNLMTSGISNDPVFNRKLLEAEQLLGPLPKMEETDPRSRFPRELTLLSDLWSGPGGMPRSNKYLAAAVIYFHDETMADLIRIMAPPVLFEGNPTMKMKYLYFNRAKVDQYTHTGTPRLVTYTWDTWDVAIQRHGLGAEFDEEAIGTPEGTELIRQSIKQIQYAILDFCGIDLINALLYCKPQPANFYEAHRLPLPTVMAMRAFEPELAHWGIMQKTEHGLAKLVSFARRQIELQQGEAPNAVIMPRGVADFMRFSRPELTDYIRKGPLGPARQEASGAAVMAPSLAGLTVIAAPLVPDVNNELPARDPLRQPRMIGEFWPMAANVADHLGQPWSRLVVRNGAPYTDSLRPRAPGKPAGEEEDSESGDSGGSSGLSAPSAASELKLAVPKRAAAYDEDDDEDPEATQQALERAAVYLKDINTPSVCPYGDKAAVKKTARSIWIHDNDSDNMVEMSIEKIQNFFKMAKELAEHKELTGDPRYADVPPGLTAALSDKNVMKHIVFRTTVEEFINDSVAGWDDYHVLLVRPHMLYAMSCFIFAKSGGATADTHVGYGDARWGRDATRKKALIHYTTYAGAVVKKPQNVWIAHAVHADEYLDGGGVRLGVDIFPILIPRDRSDIDEAIVHRKAFFGLTEDAFTGVLDDSSELLLTTCRFWSDVYGFRRNASGILHTDFRNMQEHNARVFRAPFEYARVTVPEMMDPRGNHSLGKGHWGPFAYDGVGAARLGRGPTPYVRDPYCAQVRMGG